MLAPLTPHTRSAALRFVRSLHSLLSLSCGTVKIHRYKFTLKTRFTGRNAFLVVRRSTPFLKSWERIFESGIEILLKQNHLLRIFELLFKFFKRKKKNLFFSLFFIFLKFKHAKRPYERVCGFVRRSEGKQRVIGRNSDFLALQSTHFTAAANPRFTAPAHSPNCPNPLA